MSGLGPLACWATRLGVPLPTLLDAARHLLRKKCSRCQLGTMVLRRIRELGPQKTEEILTRILATKNPQEIEKIKQELDG